MPTHQHVEDHAHGPDQPCAQCGQPTSPTDRHVRFSWPDALYGEDPTTIEGLWLSHDTPEASVMLQTADAAFVRVLLPIRLDDGGSVTYGVWWQVEVEDMHRAFAVWTAPEYVDLRLEGRLANDVPPGQAVGAAGIAVVRDPDQTPYVDDSNHPLLNRLLVETWPATLFS